MRPYWTPSSKDLESSQISKFRQFANDRYGLDLKDYWDLWKWSVGTPEDINRFWVAIWDFTGIVGEKGVSPVSFVR
jgi:acetoacetyl-CoA synthetase